MLGATGSRRRLRKERGSGEQAARHGLFTQPQPISRESGIWRRHDAKLKENKTMDKQEPNRNTSTLTFDPLQPRAVSLLINELSPSRRGKGGLGVGRLIGEMLLH